MADHSVFHKIFLIISVLVSSQAGEYTFELADRDQQCFHEQFSESGKEAILEFQVIRGGNFDVDLRLFAPSGKILYDAQRKQYDSISFKIEDVGEYYFCFSNEFSSYTHKTVYFDLISDLDEDEPPYDKIYKKEGEGNHAYTQMERSLRIIHESLKMVEDYQTHHRLREAKGRNQAEKLNKRIFLWSLGEAIIIFVVGVCQVFILRRFFTEKRSTI